MIEEIKTTPLSEIATLYKGKPPAVMPYYGDDAAPCLSPQYLRGKDAAELAKPGSNAVWVDDGDTVLLWDGSNAGEVFRGRKGLLASTMTLLRYGDEFDSEFFFYSVKAWETHLKGQTSGSGIPHVDKEVLGKLEILKLSKCEQTQIAVILSTISKAIEQTEAIIAKQQRIKTGLMQDLLTRGIDEHGNIRSEQTHQFKDSPLGRIPVEWEVKSLGEIIAQYGGLIQTGPFGSQLHAHEYVQEGIPVVMPQDITVSGISTFNIARITKSKSVGLSRHKTKLGDLVFARRGDLSRCAVINQSQLGWVCGTGCLLVRPPNRVLSSRWTCEIYRYYTTQKQVGIQAVGSTMVNLNTNILSSLLIPFIDYDEQRKIEDRLSETEKYQVILLKQLHKLQSLRTGLMQDLLTGKVPVTELLKQNPRQHKEAPDELCRQNTPAHQTRRAEPRRKTAAGPTEQTGLGSP